MMKRNTRNWRGLLMGLAGSILGISTAAAQPTTVDIDLAYNSGLNRLEVFVRPNGAGYGDVMAGITFTIRWPSTSPATLGNRTLTCPDAFPASPIPQVTSGGFNYRTFNGFSTELLSDWGCEWPANTWVSVCTIPVANNTGCTQFQIVNDAYTAANNSDYYISLGGIELPGIIEPTPVNFGSCTTDCLGVVGGTALPGTACNDNDACTINDVWSAGCVCGGTFQDTDGDGTCDANDGCPNDPNKVAPGVCGCGTADTDSDGDGTPNCIDGCPNDPNKIAPGVCGCGTADTDSDGDGTPNCIDGCPNDPNKIAPGACGCGVADTDSDGDGTPNCNDGCPNDPAKTAPGVCGCGVSDADTDGDGTPNCNDGCPADPNKIAPGQCGCGVADTDTDGDGTADCVDPCPSLANVTPGTACDDGNALTINDAYNANCVCVGTPVGCVVAGDCDDSNVCTIDDCVANACVYTPAPDSDSDGTCDAIDGCPNDPNKIAPGVCGCGTADTDTDGDGTADCNDGCPADPAKIAPGICGCGVADTDTDSDGTPDCNDGCPADPNKTAPGICGCGVSDVDTDSDGTADCNDGCPNDPNKVAPGICGCGVADTDTDSDGIADCNDNCPNLPGVQGDACDDGNALTVGDVITANCVCAGTPVSCVVAGDCDDSDVCTIDDCVANACVYTPAPDGDGDGTCDAIDGCPTDPNKIAPGACGCGVADTDTDGDGLADCIDPCPILANVTPGDPCDDGNALTINDAYSANCICEGTPVGCVVAGDCNDNDDCTIDDCVSSACVYTPVPDSDGDGSCDAIDGCPNDPNKVAPGLCGCGNAEPGTACDDGNAGTINDQIDANCACVGTPVGVDCEGTPGGTALPGTACDDGDANTGNDTWSANCVCVGLPLDCNGVPGGTATIGSPCDDGDVCTTGDVYNASCVCEGTFQDTDNDGVCDATDNCPTVAGQIGSSCDDGNANTINDVLNANCQCQGQPIGGCTENLTLSITLDANGSETEWTLYDATQTGILYQGGPYGNGTPGAVIDEPLCVPVGCYHLEVTDAGGNGISGGGYVLRDANGKRIIDATVGGFSSTSEITGTNDAFCVPVGAINMLNNWCDRSDLLIQSPVYCNAQPGASGYQFWLFDPHGTYNRRVLLPNPVLVPVTLNTNPVPTNTWLNIRVRPVIGGNPGLFGPACRVRFVPNSTGSREVLFDEATSVVMSLYPNPNRDGLVTLNLQGLEVTEETVATVDVYDMLGNRVFAERTVAAQGIVNHRMDLGRGIGSGLYMVNVTVNGTLYTQRLVIQ